MPFAAFLPAIGQLASGLIGGITGIGQRRKGRKILDALQFPTESMPSEVADMANEGLPQQQYDKAMRDIQRQQAGAIGASMDRRGGLATIGTLTQMTNDATTNLNAQDADMRQQNRRYVAGMKRDLFDKNVRQKYQMDRDYGMSLLGAGNQNFTGGLDKMASAGLLAGDAYMRTKYPNQYSVQ